MKTRAPSGDGWAAAVGGGLARGRTRWHVRGSRAIAAMGSMTIWIALSAGCRSQPPANRPGEPLMATYLGRTVTVIVPERVPMPAAAAAAVQTAQRRGYAVQEADVAGDRMWVTTKPPGAGWLDRVVVEGDLHPRGTRLRVRVEPLGGETLARAWLDDVLVKLGL